MLKQNYMGEIQNRLLAQADYPLYGSARHKMDAAKLLELFYEEQLELLYKNSSDTSTGKNNIPVARLDIPKLGCTFLITELDQNDPSKAFGLSDYDTDLRLGRIDLANLLELAVGNGDNLITKSDFIGKYPLAVYVQVAQSLGTLVTDDSKAGFQHVFQRFLSGKDTDPSLKLQDLKRRFVWNG